MTRHVPEHTVTLAYPWSTREGAAPAPVPETEAGAPAPTPVIDNDTEDVLEDLASLAELDNDTEDFDLAVADAFAAK